MPPIPEPLQDQIEKVREIARLKEHSAAAQLIDRLNDSQWANTMADIAEWGTVRDNYVEIKNGKHGLNLSAEERRLKITNRVRERLGLNPVNMAGVELCDSGSESVPMQAVF